MYVLAKGEGWHMGWRVSARNRVVVHATQTLCHSSWELVGWH